MSSAITGYDCFCQDCEKRFELSHRITRVVNLDVDGFEKDNFILGSLNRVSCPICKNEFTYETPMLVFSMNMKFACMVIPNLTKENADTLKDPPHLILPNGFIYRVVRYQVEALEKHRIFSALLDDLAIEYIKLNNFSDNQAMPFDERNIIFDSFSDGVFTFNQIDYNNNIINTYHIKSELPDFDYKNFCRLKWLKIDRETLKEDGIYA